ncbi:hypothetical protein [Aquamicrobium soli]|uniref:VanZ-like domain-containing protein n=1 Tax=Aquamicrobium soli TaxID=1811518 RepID=A0ABV7KA99_9HYPH
MLFIVHDKAWLGQVLHVSDKTLHMVVGLALFFLFLKFTKSPSRAILGVFAIELINEINDTVVAYPDLSKDFWLDTSTDILATMVLPCLTAGWLVLRRRSSMRSG